MSQYALWLLPLFISALIGVVACLRTSLRWSYGYLAQHTLVAAAAVCGFIVGPDWFWTILGWSIFLALNLGRRILLNGIFSCLGAMKPEEARLRARLLPLVAWGTPAAFWQDLVEMMAAYSRQDIAEAERLARKWSGDWVPVGTREALEAYSMLGQMFNRDWRGILARFQRLKEQYGKTSGPGKGRPFPTQVAMPVSRAYAELGLLDQSVEVLELADVPASMYGLEAICSVFMTFFALAGDREDLEKVLLRMPKSKTSLSEYARKFWQGRCEFARGNYGDAVRYYAEALFAVPSGEHAWRERLVFNLELARQAAMKEFLSASAKPGLTTALEATGDEGTGEEASRAALACTRARNLLNRALLVHEIMVGGRRRGAISWISSVLCGVYALQVAAGFTGARSLVSDLWAWAIFNGMLQGDLVLAGQYWRMFTYLFLHANLSHLFMNLLGLFWLGTHVENVFGSWRFLGIFLLSGVLSGVGQVLLTPDQAAVGASGAVMGIFGASAAATLRLKNVLPPKVRKSELTWMLALAVAQLVFDQVVNLAFELRQGSGDAVRIASVAHLTGMVSGFLLGFLVPLRNFDNKPG